MQTHFFLKFPHQITGDNFFIVFQYFVIFIIFIQHFYEYLLCKRGKKNLDCGANYFVH